MGDFTTAVKYNMDITHVLLNNGELGKISKEQRAGEWRGLGNQSSQSKLRCVRQSMWRQRACASRKAEQLESTLSEALAHDGPSLVEISTDVELV